MTQLRRPRFSITEIMGWIAGVAVACLWPPLILLVIGAATTWLLHHKMGVPLLMICLLMVIVGSVAGLVIPLFMHPVVAH